MKIAVVGGGLSGSLITMYLMRMARQPLTIYLFEKNMGQLNRGVAYSSRLPYQLLNVPVKDMSLFNDTPSHFFDWLNTAGYKYDPNDFAPRDFYGRYISETFSNETEKPGHKLSIIPAEVTGIAQQNSAYEITSGKNETSIADKIILCTGNFPPGDVPGLPQSVRESKCYISHPWGGFDVNRLSSRENILMVGSGLTMLDLVLSLNHNDHIGKITVISRRGLLPLPHGSSEPHVLSTIPSGSLSTIQLLKWVKDEVKLAESKGKSWRTVTDAIRPYIQQLWSGLSLEEKKQFLRHLRPFWEIHRHKMPVESLTILNRMKQDGRLQIIAGRIKEASVEGDKIKVGYAARGTKEIKYISVNHIINCTGPETEYRKLRSSLYNSLVENKLAEPDELSLGLKATKEGLLIDTTGKVNGDIAIVGPPAKGVLWECTALREIREQAAVVVQNILNAQSVNSTD